MQNTKIKNFTDLVVWQKSHALVIKIYNTTKIFPKSELFGLVDQLRRAAVSITSNIAEGFGRSSIKDKSHFYTISLGSLFEIENQLIICRDLGYIDSDCCTKMLSECLEINKIISVVIKKFNNAPY